MSVFDCWKLSHECSEGRSKLKWHSEVNKVQTKSPGGENKMSISSAWEWVSFMCWWNHVHSAERGPAPWQLLVVGGEDSGEMDDSKVSVQQEISLSQFCRVFKETCKEQPVAVKEFLSTIPLRDKRKMKQEAKSLLNLDHSNIINFYGVLSGRCAIVTDFLEKQIMVEDEQIWVNDVCGLIDNVNDNFN